MEEIQTRRVKQNTTKQPMGQQGNQKNIFRIMKMEIYKILWDTTQAVLRTKFTVIHAYIKK